MNDRSRGLVAVALALALALAGAFVAPRALAQPVAKNEQEDALRPDLKVKGASTGAGEASVAMAFWFVRPVPENVTADWTPTAWTLALDASAQTKDGLGQLLLGNSEAKQTFSAPVTWSLGVSVGMVGQYSARELFGDAPYAPSEATIVSMDRALRVCEGICTATKDAKGCDRYQKFVSSVRGDKLFRWFEANVPVMPKLAEPISTKLNELIPNANPKCQQAQNSLGKPIADYVASGEGMAGTLLMSLANAFAAAAATCSAECESTSSTSVECQGAKVTKAALKATEQFTATEAFPDVGTGDKPGLHLCDAGQRSYDGDAPPSRVVEAARYPRWKVALGGSIGFTPHKYLEQTVSDDGVPRVVDVLDASGTPTGETLPQLAEQKKTYGSWKAGVSGAYLPVSRAGAKYALTLEGRFNYQSITEGQSTAAEWCETKGVVGDTPSSPKASACRSLPLGKPSSTDKLLADAYVGFADVSRGLYRIALGPRWTYSAPEGEDSDNTHAVGVRLPFSLNMLAAPRNEQKLDYDGLIRITPYYEAAFEGSKAAVHSGGIVVELLGRRSLFSTRYDEL